MVGGDLHWIWEPYGIYQDVDYVSAPSLVDPGPAIWHLYSYDGQVYGLKALEENNGFTSAQCKAFPNFLNVCLTIFTALLNLVETSLNLAYVYLAHVSSWSGAPLIGFAAATMTLSKTALYWAQEFYCGGCAVGHNAWGTLFLYWVIPNGCVFSSSLTSAGGMCCVLMRLFCCLFCVILQFTIAFPG